MPRSTKFPLPVDPWSRHVADWSGCARCRLSETRSKVVLARGSFPCDVLFVGEAPGKNEDVVGLPFVGPAGRVLNDLIDRCDLERSGLTYGVTNAVCCLPGFDEHGRVARPDKESMERCKPRLLEAMTLADMRAVVVLGSVAWELFDEKYNRRVLLPEGVRVVRLVHPAGILQANHAQQEHLMRRCVVQLRDLCEALVEER